MSLSRVGDNRSTSISIWEAALAIGVVLSLCALGCAGSAHGRRARPSVVEAARREARVAELHPSKVGDDPSADLVARALHDTGLRFGTDGSARSLWGYLRTAHALVPSVAARPGDIVFFDTGGSAARPPECADHAGIVTSVDARGRIAFIEVREGHVRTSYVHPGFPAIRRDANDQVLNSFLRPKKIDDPPDRRYFAGQMLCAVARVSRG
ncbi:MAG TPA: CHAP domain-containing protein [Polyangia bacterium]|jgi:hypothetical protein|nr:CHAP domain-containing protein [Polyangia bacterium]